MSTSNKKEVSCKILQPVFLACLKKGIRIEKIIHDIPYDKKYLSNKHERIEWNTFVRIIKNLRTYFDAKEFEEIGTLHVTPGFYPEGILAGLIFFSSNKFSRILVKKVFKIGDMMISCIKHEINFPGNNNIFVKLDLDNNYKNCPDFFIWLKSYWSELGKLVGHKNFKIILDLTERGATYDISWEKEGIVYNIKKRLMWLFNIRKAFNDLTESHEELLKRHNELEESKRILQKQTTQLKTVHNISKSIKQNLDIKKTLSEITSTLIKDAEFTYARVILLKDIEGNNFEIESISGVENHDSKTIIRDLEINKNTIGKLFIQPKINSYNFEIDELLNYLIPVINISVHDALLLRTITDYKNNLETKVKTRTFELQKAQNELSKTIQLLREAQQSQSRFFANISHEFRTPLTLIFGPASDIEENSTDVEAKKNAGLIKRNADRLYNLVNQLLDLSKFEAGKMKLSTTEQNIIPLIRGLVLSFTSLAERKNIALNLKTNKEILKAYIDKEKLEKIINNLLSNAFKFTPEGGEIIFYVGQRDNNVEIKVSDTGTGIPKERIDKIFNRFYQVDGSHTREREGTGIGLSLTKELVEIHRGKIILESKEGAGTTFTVLLPLGKEHLKQEEIVEKEVQEEKSETRKEVELIPELENRKEKTDLDVLFDTEKPLLLIVEDNSDVRKYIISHLEKDYRIQEAVDGEDGWNRAVKQIPDLIISDIMMPKMDGFELCEKLKTDERTSHVPIIMLTAKATSKDKIEGYETGADDYIMKPFDAKELKARIKNLIEIRKKLQEKFRSEDFISPKEFSSLDAQFIQKAIGIINEHISEENFSIEEFAGETALSRRQLHRKLTALTGKTPSQFLRLLRLARAKTLIKEKKETISEISYQVGFNSPAYFNKCFKEEYGYSPGELNT